MTPPSPGDLQPFQNCLSSLRAAEAGPFPELPFIFHQARGSKTRQEQIVAKEQKRGNREAKKPKAVKSASADASPPKMALGQLAPIKKPAKAR